VKTHPSIFRREIPSSPEHNKLPAVELSEVPSLSQKTPRFQPVANPGGLIPLACMSLAMLLVGATAPLGELALAGIPLFPVLAVRLVLAAATLSAWDSREKEDSQRLALRHWIVLAVQALCGVVVFNSGLWLGMRVSGPAAAGVFTSATPVLMAVIGVLAFGERISARMLAGIGLTVAGVLAARGVASVTWQPNLGDGLLFAAVAGEAVFLLALKWLPGGLSPLTAAKRITWIGFGLVLPLALAQIAQEGLPRAGGGSWLAVAALGVLVTAGGYVLWFKGVVRARPSQAAVVTGLMPVSAVLSSWLLLGVAPSFGQSLGCLAVGAGIMLSARKE
jgi:drug/metabolite transporter (DMT)-like permease